MGNREIDLSKNNYSWKQDLDDPNTKYGIVHEGVEYKVWFNKDDKYGYRIQDAKGKNLFGDRWFSDMNRVIRTIKNIQGGSRKTAPKANKNESMKQPKDVIKGK